MVGDGEGDAVGGMYWGQRGPWLCSDMLKGNAIEMGHCGSDMWGSIFNVYVDAFTVQDRLKTILLLQAQDFVLLAPYVHRDFEAPSE